jgi:arsenate reductase
MTVLYHNPRCSKSREALALLEQRGVALEVVRYLETPPTEKELSGLLRKLGMRPRDLLRSKEPLCTELDLANPKISDAEFLRAMAANPVLIERPILVSGRRAVIGRPPERVLEII